MYANAKTIPTETTPGIGRKGDKGEGRGGKFMYDIFGTLYEPVHRFLYNVPLPCNVTLPSTTIKGKKKVLKSTKPQTIWGCCPDGKVLLS
jgi:hypothetical protein